MSNSVMKRQFMRIGGILGLGWVFANPLFAEVVEWNVHQAFSPWVEGERWLVFAKIANVGDEVIPLAGQSTGSVTQQLRLIPEWKKGMAPHVHGHHSHSHLLPDAAQPWKSTLDWRKWPLNEFDEAPSRALMPGQGEVLGDMALRLLWMDYGMPNPHISSFKLALRFGPDRYAVSEPQELKFADVDQIESYPVIAEIEKANGRKTPIRQIDIAGETWLFQRSFRVARVPEGGIPRFRTEDGKETFVIEFDDRVEEPVRVNIAQAFPLSGSEKTVPHLHLWRSLTDRSMFELAGSKGGFFKETGLTLEQARTLKWDGSDPELKVGSDGRIQGFRDLQAVDQPREDGVGLARIDAEENSEVVEAETGKWVWVLIGSVLAGALVLLVKRGRRKDAK